MVDDGSIDDTRKILLPFVEKGVIQYILQENQGAGAARNTGIMVAKGEYIAFLDADDFMLENSLMKRQRFLNKYPDVSLVFSDYYIKKKNFQLGHPRLKKKVFLNFFHDTIFLKDGNRVIFDQNFYYKYLKFVPHPIWTCTVMIRKEIISDIGLFRTDISVSEDRDFWMKIAEKYNLGFIDEPLAIYNTYRSNLTKNIEKYCIDRIKIFSTLLEHSKLDKYTIKKRISETFFDLGYYYFTLGSISKAKKMFWKSITYQILIFRAWKCLLMCCLPSEIVQILKRLKNQTLKK